MEMVVKIMNNGNLIEVKNLKAYFPITKGFFKKVTGHVKAVDDVSFSIKKGETFSLVGESGCGKTTTGRAILRAIEPTEGEVFFNINDKTVDVTGLPKKELKNIWRNMQLIFQDPYSSLNPRMTVKQIIEEPLIVNGYKDKKKREDIVYNLLEKVGIRFEYATRYPHAFSGGQRQRIGIARSLALNPKFVVCDESVSALDVSVQAQILNLLSDLQEEFNLTYLFISHDLSVINYISDRVAVMYVGKIVEIARSDELFMNPGHPYTEALLSAVPKNNPDIRSEPVILEGEVADPSNPPTGCYFHPRCRYAKDICKKVQPELKEINEDEHYVACHFSQVLKLKGIDFI